MLIKRSNPHPEKIQVGHLVTCSTCGQPMVKRLVKQGGLIATGEDKCMNIEYECTECLKSEKDTCYNSESET